MYNFLKPLPALVLAFLAIPALAQQEHIGKLIVDKKKVFTAPVTHLRIDTLVLHNNASIQFAAGENNTLEVKHGYIGNNCSILAIGANGKNGSLGSNGADGSAAGHLSLDIHLEQLGNLTIDTRGGNGGDGYVGRNGRRQREETHTQRVPNGKGGYTTVIKEVIIDGTAGEQGTAPGLGGNGGNLVFRYSTSGFVPNFNRTDAPHSITLFYQAGQPGNTGKDGVSHERGLQQLGMKYQPAHKALHDGTVKIEKVTSPHLKTTH
ncbi:MAG: hypothetical protein LPK03_10720 [Pontibacter sp.]|nr:hypothetical protein [Pontibacter sp.]